ncbi:MAG: hypothetical protein JWN70_5388, partial [Planctomycetaceae bacterium]|nr:hypothetical protein [Planctomycetaceae bacterium]
TFCLRIFEQKVTKDTKEKNTEGTEKTEFEIPLFSLCLCVSKSL